MIHLNERFSSLPCASHPEIISKLSLLKKCEIGSREVDCNKMFTKVTTDGGMCCSFNMKDIFKDSQYSELIRDLQNSDQTDSGSYQLKLTFEMSEYFLSSQVLRSRQVSKTDQERI